MQVSVLGATEVWRDDERVELGTRKRRALVAALALHAGRPVSVDGLVDLLWGDSPPDGVAGTLQVYVSGLRRALEPDRPPRAPATVLVTVAPGYALHLPDDALDAWRFDRAVTTAHRRLTGGASLTGEEYAATLGDLDAALSLWRGDPYLELDDHPQAVAERARLEEVRTVAIEDRAVAALALGDHGTVAAELEALTAAYPLRERLWALRALALTRSGRQADALDVLRQVRDVLADELGLEPGQELRDLQTAVLRQDPALAWTPPSGGTSAVPARQPAEAAPTPETPAPTPAAPPTQPPTLPAWPLVGRDDQLATLVGSWDQAEQGNLTFVSLTGEPGIGKSRLCAELAHVVAERGGRLLLGRCSQDDGAPPLWPWQQVLIGLGQEMPAAEIDDEGAEFRTWQTIRDRVLAAAADEPVLLVLDDLHWADVPTLRVLRMLVDGVDGTTGVRLLVLLTWRPYPEPTGALADTIESLARRHAVRLPLTGLAAGEAAEVVGAVADAVPTDEQADRLAARTDGNPFFLVEYARLARDRGDLGDLLDDLPTAVTDVLTRRLDRLPDQTGTLLRWAAVIGREFDLGTLAEAASVPEDDVLDALDPALEGGLLREEGIGRYLFGHALVRDTAYAAWTATRRARAHARVATVLEDQTDHPTEVARHWLAAGPSHAGQAWRAASAAATEVIRTSNAYTVASDLLGAALDALADDPQATLEDRYRLLMERIEAFRWQADWISLLAHVGEAIEVAERLDDVLRLSDAACSTTRGALWQSPAHGTDHPPIVSALRRVLEELPDGERERRCRAMLALAAEGYYTTAPAEREALVDEAIALARSIGDDHLLLQACETGYVCTWRPATLDTRLALGQEGREISRRLGEERSAAVADTLVAVALGESGRVAEMWELGRAARAEADRLHLPYCQLVLDALFVPWLVQAGRTQEAMAYVDNTVRLAREMRVGQAALAELGAVVSVYMWTGRNEELAGMMQLAEDEVLPMVAATTVTLDRAGRTDEAVEHARTHTVDLAQDNWFSMLNWCCAAEVALLTGDRELATATYDLLAPYAGRCACAGSGTTLGPVDLFLAQAAAAVGELDLARRHAHEGARLCEEWQVPLVTQWWRDQRDRFGF